MWHSRCGAVSVVVMLVLVLWWWHWCGCGFCLMLVLWHWCWYWCCCYIGMVLVFVPWGWCWCGFWCWYDVGIILVSSVWATIIGAVKLVVYLFFWHFCLRFWYASLVLGVLLPPLVMPLYSVDIVLLLQYWHLSFIVCSHSCNLWYYLHLWVLFIIADLLFLFHTFLKW